MEGTTPEQTAAPCSWAGRARVEILHLQQTSWADGCRAGGWQPSGNTLPLSWNPEQEGRAGTERQDRPGHNHCSVLAAPGPHAHTCTNTQPSQTKTHSQQPPTHSHTHSEYTSAQPRTPARYAFFQAEKLIPGALVLTPPACPSGPLRHPDPPMPKAWSCPSSPHH